MTIANRVYNNSVMRDFCAEVDLLQFRKYKKNGMVANESYLIADTFLIMFSHQFLDSYVYETMDEIKQNKSLYRFEVKKVCNEITDWLDKFSKEYYGCMTRSSQGNVADMGISLESALDKNMELLHDAIYDYVKNNIKGDTEIITRILICAMLADWCVVYMNSRIKDSIKENPIITRISWMSHEGLRKLIYKLDSLFGTPDKINDIKVHAQWCKFQKLWCDADFIADNLGDNQPTDYTDGSSCQMELKELFNNKTISKI